MEQAGRAGAVLAGMLIGWLLAGSALAVDGVIEINHARAEAGGVTSTDAPGFPVTIDKAGSYRLTSRLTVNDAAGMGIEIKSSLVTLDLGGFALEGDPGVGPPGNGIDSSGRSHVVIRNGHVVDFDGACISAGNWTRIEELMVSSCARGGIVIGDDGLVQGNIVSGNSGTGLVMGDSTGYLKNQITNGGSGDVSGGTPLGINLCSGSSCATPPLQRRFYMTTTTHNGANATSACASGYHMASLWEIHDTSQLRYNGALGRTLADSGSGPPAAQYAWVRTGYSLSITPTPGQGNCSVWTSANPAHSGTWAALGGADWMAASERGAPWLSNDVPCDVAAPVWCVEN